MASGARGRGPIRHAATARTPREARPRELAVDRIEGMNDAAPTASEALRRAVAARWFGIWGIALIAMGIVVLLTAGSAAWTGTILGGSALATAVILATTRGLERGIRGGRFAGLAALLVGFFALSGILPVAILLARAFPHPHPWIIGTTLAIFWLITARTLLALIVLLANPTPYYPRDH